MLMPPPGRPPLRRHPNLRCHPNLRLHLASDPFFYSASASLSLSLAALACPSLTSFAACACGRETDPNARPSRRHDTSQEPRARYTS